MTDSASNNEPRSRFAEKRTPEVDDARYHVRNHESVTEAVVRAIHSKTQSDGTTLPLLYSTVDPDALNKLFDSKKSGSETSQERSGTVGFTYAGHYVQVTSDGTIGVVSEDEQ